MREQGLYRLGGLVLAAILVVSALAYATSGGRSGAYGSDVQGRPGPATPAAETPGPVAPDAVCVPDGASREGGAKKELATFSRLSCTIR